MSDYRSTRQITAMSERLRTLGLVPFFIQQLTDTCMLEERLGRVTSVQRSRSTVVCESGERVVELSPALRQSSAIDRPVVGDWVVLDESLSRIEKVLERKSLFKRLGAGTHNEIQPIAANIDVLFIVTSCNEEFKESRLERYLALCAEAGATPVIVLTKADLVADASTFIRRARSVQAGVPIEIANALDPATLDGVRAWIDRTSTVALVGSSGVGKSTLLNTLAGRALAATGDIREDDKKGRHTTTHRELHVLPSGGLLIDVPGMRELRVAELGQSIGAVFEDIQLLATQCRFVDCKHETEPGCAVLRAIEENRIDARRLANYKKLLRENALATATLAEKRSQGREFARMVKEVKLIKQRKSDG
ncbi:MAG: ribosome small subunit-dependent GTPase A [Gammaproteobacteria bacterium]|nr:ribosome small subunit-dependent GTPase A [Gammaproteobacteria bacterium]MDP2140481.1 ribosome small subunit-dependent GTPase A [Gammaproteobacteria bacterium]MDP2349520.1 ribosome small subunit-dependent GTPase A [Gammaproteobacteria bacterium]